MTAAPGPVRRSGLEWAIDRSTFHRRARDRPPTARVPLAATVSVTSPWRAFRRARAGPWAACFETLGGTDGWNGFGVTPTATCTVDPADLEAGRSLDALETAVGDPTLSPAPEAGPIPGGWFGWISYDVARELESLPASTERDRDLPHLQFARFDTIASWRSRTGDGPVELRVASSPVVGDDPAAAYERGRRDIEALVDRIDAGTPGAPWGDPDGRVRFAPGCDRGTYRDRVRRVKAYVRDGDTFQVNLSQRFDAAATRHPVDAYAALREANPAPYCGYLETPDVTLASTSPELLLEREGDRLRTEPIAGTRPRGATPNEDEALAAELAADEKERAEHAMLVDLERNDLGKVAVPGSVEVAEYRRVDRYASVWHLVSDVRARLDADVGLGEMLGAMLPGGTVTGAPKPRTMAIIDELEDRRRGPYTGAMAVVGFDGQVRANMVIRTLEHHDGRYRLRVGGGVVHDSDPDAEYEETLAKARAMREALEGADP
ncbi:MAG: anthranilate synthase component I family protein [Halobacteriales archaeon]